MTATLELDGQALADQYARDGFVFPYRVVDEDEAKRLRDDLEAGEAELADQPQKLALLRSYPAQLLPSFDALIRHPRMLAAASAILGPDLLVWGSGLFIKEASTESFVSWHQDLTYWGLDDAEEVTLWVALSPASKASGCMQFVPGTHTRQIVPHVDSFEEHNLLTRGQEIAVDVDAEDAVDVVLKPGEASIHHGHLFHASGPNTTDDRRIGAAIRYIKPSMKQRSGDRALVAHVAGEDRFGHFTVGGNPTTRLSAEDFERCRQDSAIKRRVLYEGAETDQGKRYA